MSDLNQLFKSIPVEKLAAQFGVDPAQVSSAVQSLLPSLVGGMQANAQDPAGAASLESALSQHAGNERLLDNVDPAAVDTQDGAKIAHHIFGSNEGAVTEKVAAASGADKSLIEKLLPIIAPIAMAWLASRIFGKKDEPTRAEVPTQAPQEQVEQRSPLEDFLGGDSAKPTGTQPQAQQQGGGIGDLLGGLLGGDSSQQQSGGGLGDLLGSLGGLLGGGRR